MSRTRRGLLVIPVLLLHGAGVWLLLHESLRGRSVAPSAAPVRMVVRALPATATPPSPEPTRPMASPAPTASRDTKKPERAVDADPPARAAVSDANQAITPPGPPDAPREAAATRDTALDLRLPRAASGAPPSARATTDPRSNSAHKGFGDVLAGRLGSDDRWIEEARGDGRLRVRKGASCVDVRPARGAELNPFDQSVRPTARLAEACD